MARQTSTALTRGYLDRLLSIGASWPVDPLRPDLHFGRAIEHAARKALLKKTSVAASPSPAATGAGANGDGLVLRELNAGSGSDVEIVERAAAALEQLRANKALKKMPTPRTILKPASQPEYYARLVQGLDRAARGEDISPTFQEKVSRFFGRVP
ncbi:unnamed protein product [Tilletia controversa]|uniref:Uncharacterized protein n=2 Tax=Tilletia TaxID=13289 RepID=A0A177T063_9BASI|nr:hypothetical protein CF328_g8966 [Tilletia controversa]KAE8181323.1 hypothetical protein CF335_g8974 [Tilletia laevis]KAE8238007.1 hypothetical protein A4X03_0g8979 [Tilletia caries]KAE8191994.1 hypothetical protein CF336_g4612 [Tilletia laevis]CAD6884799.1 unnamed protein product [Tilletia caries]